MWSFCHNNDAHTGGTKAQVCIKVLMGYRSPLHLPANNKTIASHHRPATPHNSMQTYNEPFLTRNESPLIIRVFRQLIVFAALQLTSVPSARLCVVWSTIVLKGYRANDEGFETRQDKATGRTPGGTAIRPIKGAMKRFPARGRRTRLTAGMGSLFGADPAAINHPGTICMKISPKTKLACERRPSRGARLTAP
ncbi:hypothetical protein J6590_051185 [Homalodisca vitripennis]|nr:hypothetical protein J6590_051185 [Homalodisca vitripennis]